MKILAVDHQDVAFEVPDGDLVSSDIQETSLNRFVLKKLGNDNLRIFLPSLTRYIQKDHFTTGFEIENYFKSFLRAIGFTQAVPLL